MKLSETPKNFVKCGLCGWGFECIWTGLHSALKKGEKTCLCRTSLWMFPIYGMACLIQPMHQILKRKIYWYVEPCIQFVSFVPNTAPENG